ncbi:MAG: thermonuclease family protein [Alphaproteobacteria bacterium]|nr:thermonuclease family protein [Alphaproteobacteria bacterium]
MQLSSFLRAGGLRKTIGLVGLLALVLFAERFMGTEEVAEASGRAQLVDGDSLHLSGYEVRMVGIDAPEGQQNCQKDGKTWACGREARRALERLIAGRKILCRFEGRDKHRRMLGTCEVAGRNLNQAMVEAGFAVAFGRRYVREEDAAKSARRGLWAGTFERPQDWRRQNLGTAG